MKRNALGQFISQPIFNELEDKEIAKIYNVGNSTRKIARAYKVNNKIIANALKRQTIQIHQTQFKRKWQINEFAFDDLQNEQVNYWWGFIYADGSINKKRYLNITLGLKDEQHLEKLNGFLQSDYPIYTTCTQLNNKKFHQPRLMVYSRHLANRLSQLGIVSHRLKFNRVLEHLDPTFASHWIRGYFDGDGCALKSEPRISWAGQKNLLEWIRYKLSEELGLNPERNIFKHGNFIFEINYWGRKQTRKITNYMYKDATIWLERKRAIIENWSRPQKKNEMRRAAI